MFHTFSQKAGETKKTNTQTPWHKHWDMFLSHCSRNTWFCLFHFKINKCSKECFLGGMKQTSSKVKRLVFFIFYYLLLWVVLFVLWLNMWNTEVVHFFKHLLTYLKKKKKHTLVAPGLKLGILFFYFHADFIINWKKKYTLSMIWLLFATYMTHFYIST